MDEVFDKPKVIISMDEWQHYQDCLAVMEAQHSEIEELKAYIDNIFTTDEG